MSVSNATRIALGFLFAASAASSDGHAQLIEYNYEQAEGTPEAQLGIWDAISGFLNTQVGENFPALTLLLVLGALFSTITFLDNLSGQTAPVRRTYKYLILWISVNFILSMILLILLAPAELSFGEFSRELLFYCIAVTAVPELATSLRIQIGRNTRVLDIQQYKAKVAGLISKGLDSAALDQRSRALALVDQCYANSREAFENKLALLANENDFTNGQKKDLAALQNNIKKDPSLSLNVALRDHPSIMPGVLDFCWPDLERFERSPRGRLLVGLQPGLILDEAAALLQQGVVTPRRFIWRCFLPLLRRRLARKSGLDLHRIEELFYSSRSAFRKKHLSRILWAFTVAGVLVLSISISTFYGERLSFTPQIVVRSSLTGQSIEAGVTKDFP